MVIVSQHSRMLCQSNGFVVMLANCYVMQVEDPLDEIKESIDQQKVSINALQTTLEERLGYLEDQLSTFLIDSKSS